MTNDKAVEILNAIIFMLGREYDTDEVEEAIHMAIEALQKGLENVNADEPTCNDLATDLQPSKQDDLISRHTVIDTLDRNHILGQGLLNDTLDHIADAIMALPSAQPPVLTCDGCRHVGTYDTDFPCSGCIRREKDYYEQER